MRRVAGLGLLAVAGVAGAQQPVPAIQHFIDSVRVAQKLPGLTLVVVRSEGEPVVYVSGWRSLETHDPIRSSDRMHLGSNTKAMTASVIGALVEQGLLTFETTVGETFPELASSMRPEYRSVTLAQLMSHSSGLPPYTSFSEFPWVFGLIGSPMDQRHEFAKRLLREKPLFPAGTKHQYSNAAVSLAGIVAERVTGVPYERLVDSLIFRPLGGRALFGNPARDDPAQPRGHARGRFGGTREIASDDRSYVVPAAIAPAGDASVTHVDYGRFLQLHLRGLRGRNGVLKSATIKALHTPRPPLPPDTSTSGMAFGWGVAMRDGVEVHGHAGSAGAYLTIMAIMPARDLALAISTNMGGDDVLQELGKLRPVLMRRLAIP